MRARKGSGRGPLGVPPAWHTACCILWMAAAAAGAASCSHSPAGNRQNPNDTIGAQEQTTADHSLPDLRSDSGPDLLPDLSPQDGTVDREPGVDLPGSDLPGPEDLPADRSDGGADDAINDAWPAPDQRAPDLPLPDDTAPDLAEPWSPDVTADADRSDPREQTDQDLQVQPDEQAMPQDRTAPDEQAEWDALPDLPDLPDQQEPPTAEDDDERCADGHDNDTDGLSDCADPDCSGRFEVTVCPGLVRVMTWNIHDVGADGSQEYEATRQVLLRLAPDVAAFNEVNGPADTTNLSVLADDLGYPYMAVTGNTSFGDIRNAFISRLPFVVHAIHTSASLSGDGTANDIARQILEVRVDVAGTGRDLTLTVEHWKSGFTNTDEFRKACEAFRVAQVFAGRNSQTEAFMAMGDFNAQIDDGPETPDPFTYMPTADMPSSFRLGGDLQAVLDGPGVRNNPFYYLTEAGPELEALDATQLDGERGTRPSSGRRIDYLLVSHSLSAEQPRSEIYDCTDEGLPGGLPKAGQPLPADTCDAASDHLPVFADLIVAP